MTELEKSMLEASGKASVMYGQRVTQLIREKYDINAELAILRQRDDKPTEFEAYNSYAEECKKKAKEELGI